MVFWTPAMLEPSLVGVSSCMQTVCAETTVQRSSFASSSSLGGDNDLMVQNKNALQERSTLTLSELTGCSNTQHFLLSVKRCTAATDTGRVSVPQVSIKSKLLAAEEHLFLMMLRLKC